MRASTRSCSSYIEAADYNSLTWIIFFHSLMSASQDICIDSLAIKNISESELGSINGFMQAGMLLGRSLFGGAGIYLFHLYGLNTLVYLLVTCIWLSLIASLFIEEKKTEIVGDTLTKYFSEVYGLLKSKNLWTLMSIAFLASLSFEGIAGLASATLVKKSISSEWRSWIYALGVPLLMTIGSLLGGYTLDKK